MRSVFPASPASPAGAAASEVPAVREELHHVPQHPLRRGDVAVLLLEGDQLLHHRAKGRDVLTRDHQAAIARPQRGVRAEVGVHAPLEGEARDGQGLPEVVGLEDGREHHPPPLAHGKRRDEVPDAPEEPGDRPEGVVAVVGVVEGDEDLVHARLDELVEAGTREECPVRVEEDADRVAALLQQAHEPGEVGVEKRLAACQREMSHAWAGLSHFIQLGNRVASVLAVILVVFLVWVETVKAIAMTLQ